ncbi:MAG TPA: SCO2523 family variant P-loop protein [Candidatus Limnocylindrales bacterium]|nr:SCO2523 family variant P-loop protein [Candidatus Limnocylindrales bacterium]
MLVFSTSDKGGTGRTVTSCNIAYRCALADHDVCYLDFDFGSPTAGAIFGIGAAMRGTSEGGLHGYIKGNVARPVRLDVWSTTDRASIKQRRPTGSGELILIPGDEGGSEFSIENDDVERCATLLAELNDEFELVLMDLSAGRSYATELALRATAHPTLSSVPFRWLVFHRWTQQHVLAAAGLTFEKEGILDVGARWGHDRTKLSEALGFVRTAVVDPSSEELTGLRGSQVAWLHKQDQDLNQLASSTGLGRTATLGIVPLDPVLQWSEQLITDGDTVIRHIANEATVTAFEGLAARLLRDWAELDRL